MDLLRDWYNVIARNNQLVLLIVLLVLGTSIIALFAGMLAPFFAAIILAYLLQIGIDRLERRKVSPRTAFAIAYGLFIAVILLIIGLVPLMVRQLTELVREIPQFMARAQNIVEHLPEAYPTLITADQIHQIMDRLREEVLGLGQNVVGTVGGTVVGVMTSIVYLIIIPLMVFFLVKDKNRIVAWLESFLPHHRELAVQVWHEVHGQLQNYVGGKVLQMAIVGVVSYVAFYVIDLNFAPLLAAIIALSVLIPYVGPALATLPVAIVAILEWGFTFDAGIALAAYGVIHFFDGNILVPLLFSEAVAIHPVAIIVAILFFGGIWGVWGVFFAIPLAVVVKAVINAWPRRAPGSAVSP